MKVVVDGIIGAGKSTLLRALVEHDPRIRVRPEPVQEWEPLLQLMYDDPERWTATFNINALAGFGGRTDEDADSDAGTVWVHERSPLACRHVFCDLGHRLGHMTDAEMRVVDAVYGVLAWRPPDVIVYLRTPPGTAFERMNQRGRASEAKVPIEYIQQLHEAYEHMMTRVLPQRYPDIRIVTLDGAGIVDIHALVRALEAPPQQYK